MEMSKDNYYILKFEVGYEVGTEPLSVVVSFRSHFKFLLS